MRFAKGDVHSRIYFHEGWAIWLLCAMLSLSHFYRHCFVLSNHEHTCLGLIMVWRFLTDVLIFTCNLRVLFCCFPPQVPPSTCDRPHCLWRIWSGGKPRPPSPLPLVPSGCVEGVALLGEKSAWPWWRGEEEKQIKGDVCFITFLLFPYGIEKTLQPAGKQLDNEETKLDSCHTRWILALLHPIQNKLQ